MRGDTIRITGGIVARVTSMSKDDYDVSGSFGKYAFNATVCDKNQPYGILGGRIIRLEVFRSKKSLFGYTRVFPILRCSMGKWSIKTPNQSDFNAACALVYKLDQFLPRFNRRFDK